VEAPALEVVAVTGGPFAENSYFLFDAGSREAVAIDPGAEPERLLEVIREQRLKVRRILCTHAHIDHVAAVPEVKAATGAPWYLHAADRFLLDGLAEQAAYFGLRAPGVPPPDGGLAEGDVIHLGPGEVPIRVFETPGHSPGSVSLAVGGAVVFGGDVLFAGSIGRTDLPGGDHETLLRSIRERLLVLPDATTIYPGHGPPTTIGRERRTNPFLA
jgi:glyoxylase-like metal-dependent hydrolase (beta-lactamase superfamily II)